MDSDYAFGNFLQLSAFRLTGEANPTGRTRLREAVFASRFGDTLPQWLRACTTIRKSENISAGTPGLAASLDTTVHQRASQLLDPGGAGGLICERRGAKLGVHSPKGKNRTLEAFGGGVATSLVVAATIL